MTIKHISRLILQLFIFIYPQLSHCGEYLQLRNTNGFETQNLKKKFDGSSQHLIHVDINDAIIIEELLGELLEQDLDLSIFDKNTLVGQLNQNEISQLHATPFVTEITPFNPKVQDETSRNKKSNTFVNSNNLISSNDRLDSCDGYQTPINPALHTDMEGEQVSMTYYSKPLSNEFPGLIYLPSQNGRVIDGQFPLAIIAHGRNYDYNWYQEMQRHLARNGIASVSIQYSETHSGLDYYASEFIEHFKRHMNVLFGNLSADYNPAHNKFNRKIALIGHSMGGGFAVHASQWLTDQAQYNVNLMSVVNLAPNPQETEWYLTPNEAQGLLVIFGSDDQDGGVNLNNSSGFLTYDRSGHLKNEYSFNGYQPQRFTKSFVYVKGANHNSFIDSEVEKIQGPYHEEITGYINAYMRWSLLNDYSMQTIFKQQHNFVGPDPQITLQYSDPIYRRVLDHFEGYSEHWNAMGGNNLFSQISFQKKEAKANGNIAKSAHETQILSLEWQASNQQPKVDFYLPFPYTFGLDYRDLRRLRYLSFRMGQVFNSNGSDEELNFYIRLTSHLNGELKTQKVSLNEVGIVPSPLAKDDYSNTKTTMNTVIVPLCLFNQIDLERVIKVSFEFNHPDRPQGKIQMDSLEFIY